MGEEGVREEATGISRWTMMVVGSGVGSLLCRLFSFHCVFLSFFSLIFYPPLTDESSRLSEKYVFRKSWASAEPNLPSLYVDLVFDELISLATVVRENEFENRFLIFFFFFFIFYLEYIFWVDLLLFLSWVTYFSIFIILSCAIVLVWINFD